MIRKIAIAAFLMAIVLLNTAIMEASPEASVQPESESEYDVQLIVFLYDRCGGCGVDSPGCGNCQDMVTYHGIIKGQLGDRLYDGTILYRMFNCRLEAHDHEYDNYFAVYEAPQELYGYLPVAFIGTPEGGLYVVGEEMLGYVGEYVDAYLDGGDIADLQAEIDSKRAELHSTEPIE